jgi:hypothetical protein
MAIPNTVMVAIPDVLMVTEKKAQPNRTATVVTPLLTAAVTVGWGGGEKEEEEGVNSHSTKGGQAIRRWWI